MTPRSIGLSLLLALACVGPAPAADPPRLDHFGDPLPTYIPPHEDPLTRPDLAARFPLQLLSPPEPTFLNSTFVNVASLRPAAGPTLLIHPDDAAARGVRDGQRVRSFNDRSRSTG